MKNILITIILTNIILTVAGQQAITHNQYHQYRTTVSSASTLMQNGSELSFIGRRQWVGIEGAPTVYWGSGHITFEQIRATTGFTLRHENIAVEKHTEASVFFAKGIRLSENEYIGLALNAGLAVHNGNFSSLDPTDPAFRDDIRETGGLLGFSAIFYRPEKYYVGLSMPRLMLNNLGNAGNRQYDFRNQYHAMSGALFALGTDFHIKPSILITYAANLKTQFDFSTILYMQRIFGLGLNVRNYGDIAALAQVNYQGFGFGYSYQFNPKNKPLNRRMNNSTHEIALHYRFGGKINLL